MRYKIDLPRFGKFFTVPCSAAENYLKTADGLYFKVLLCLLCSNDPSADSTEVAKRCGCEKSAVEDAVLFWTNEGVILAEAEDGSTGIAAKPAAAAPPAAASSAAVCAEKKPPAPRPHVRYSNKEIAEKIEQSSDLKTLFDEVQRLLGRTINSTETLGFIDIYEYYGYDVPSIMMITDFCRSQGKTRIAYIESVARDWYQRGICDIGAIEQEIIRQTEQLGFNRRIASALGIEGRLTKKQEEHFCRWRDWGFDCDMIMLADERCRNKKNRTDLNYINGILSRWQEAGLTTAAAVEESERKFKDSAEKQAKAEERSYDLDSWRELAAGFDPTAIGFEEDDEE